MPAIILRHVPQAIVVLAMVAFIACMAQKFVGNPALFVAAQHPTPELVRKLHEELSGPDRFIAARFAQALPIGVQHDFGLRRGGMAHRAT